MIISRYKYTAFQAVLPFDKQRKGCSVMNRFAENNYLSQIKRNRWITTLVVIVIFFFGTLFALKGDTGAVTAQVDKTGGILGVLGTYGNACFVTLDEIDQFWLADDLDAGTMVEGEETKNTSSGLYRNNEFGEYTLHVYIDQAPYIVVRYGDGETLVFNQGRERLTRGIYEDLQEVCGE